MNSNPNRRSKTIFISIFLLLLQVGCSREAAPPAAFEPNLVHAMKYQIKEDVPTEQASEDAMYVVHQMFGTPDEPTLPAVITDDEDYASIVSMDNLHKASGPFADGRGLYRKHCANCHGITGNGRGSTAAILNPYPRDYRMGIFKFKSTKRAAKPTRSDLVKLIANGIAGTPMKKIPELSDQDIDAITDYVIYLSIRGELERTLIDDAVLELDLESGDRILDHQLATWIKRESEKRAQTWKQFGKESKEYAHPEVNAEELVVDGQPIDEDLLGDFRDFMESAELFNLNTKTLAQELADMKLLVSTHHEMAKPITTNDEEQPEELAFAEKAEALIEDFELYEESWEVAEDYAAEIAAAWFDAEDDFIEVPEAPETIPVPNSYQQFVELSQGDQAEALSASVKRGQELFVGKVASCSKCHGEKGLGDGTNNDYDDWTKDWTQRAGLKPEDRDRLIPLLARGALPPVNSLPRNFSEGVFRGGSDSKDIYRRIIAGIAGTPMPAATFVEGQFEQEDVWHIINFIRSLQKAPTESTQPAVEQTASK